MRDLNNLNREHDDKLKEEARLRKIRAKSKSKVSRERARKATLKSNQ